MSAPVPAETLERRREAIAREFAEATPTPAGAVLGLTDNGLLAVQAAVRHLSTRTAAGVEITVAHCTGLETGTAGEQILACNVVTPSEHLELTSVMGPVSFLQRLAEVKPPSGWSALEQSRTLLMRELATEALRALETVAEAE